MNFALSPVFSAFFDKKSCVFILLQKHIQYIVVYTKFLYYKTTIYCGHF